MNSWIIALQLIRRTMGTKNGFIYYIIVPAFVIALFISLMGTQHAAIITIYYVNQDRGMLSEHLIKEMKQKPGFVVKDAHSVKRLKQYILKQEAGGSFVIPEHFSDDLLAERVPKIVMYQEYALSVIVKKHMNQTIQSMVKQIDTVYESYKSVSERNEMLSRIWAVEDKRYLKTKVTDPGVVYNPAVSVATGFTLMFVMGLIITSVGMVLEDRKQKTMTRIYAAPVHSIEIALGNFLGSFVLGSLQIVFILLISRYLLNFDYGVSFMIHFVILECFLLACMGMASAVAAIIKNKGNLSAINSLITTPTCMLGGCFWPVYIMPDFMQKISNLIPQKWAIEAVETAAGGGGFEQIGMPLGVLIMTGVVLLGFGAAIVKPEDADSIE